MADRSSARLIQRLCRYDLLVIDELGYLTLKPEQVNAFFKLMGERYGKKSIILTTNLDYPEWYDLFQRKNLVDALLDRLNHHCITIHINGPSLGQLLMTKGKLQKPNHTITSFLKAPLIQLSSKDSCAQNPINAHIQGHVLRA